MFSGNGQKMPDLCRGVRSPLITVYIFGGSGVGVASANQNTPPGICNKTVDKNLRVLDPQPFVLDPAFHRKFRIQIRTCFQNPEPDSMYTTDYDIIFRLKKIARNFN
jgi:hypothetical protein